MDLYAKESEEEMKMRKYSVLWSWFVSYVIVLLIPLATILINYRMNCNTIKEELVRVNELSFDNVTNGINVYLKQLRENYVYVFLNDSFEDLKRRYDMDQWFYRSTLELQEQIHGYPNREDEMFCMVYMKNKDYLVSSENSCDADYYYKGMKYRYENFIGFEEWREVLNGDYSENYLVGKGVNYWTQKECLIYANTIKGSRQEAYNIFVSIPLSIIEGLTEYLKEDSWLLVNMEGAEPLVFHEGKLTEAPEWLEEREFFICLNKNAVFPDVSYELIFSESSIMNELSGVRHTFWISFAVTLILAFAGIAVLVHINYQPISSVMREIDEIEGLDGENEFDKLKCSYLQMKKEKKTTQQLIEKQKRELMNARLLTMMKGRALKANQEEGQEYWGLSLKGNIVLVGFMFPIEKGKEDDEELPFFIVDNIFTELMRHERFYHVEDGCFMFYLFDLLPDTEEEWRQEVYKKTEYVCELVNDKLGNNVIGVVGEIGEGISVIKRLYQNLMEAFEYNRVVGGQNVIDVRMLPDYDGFYLMEDYMDEEFRAAFESKNVDAACAILDKIFAHSGMSSANIAVIKVRAYEIFGMVMDIFGEYVSDVAQQEAAIRYLDLVVRAQTMDEIKKYFNELLQFQIKTVAREQMQESKGIVSEVVKYVEANYADYSLNLSSIAEGLGKSSRHISRVFKEKMQMGILDYINSVRIAKAKELMAQQAYTTEEIAAKVGYGDARGFRRAFVKITGETPSAYMGR